MSRLTRLLRAACIGGVIVTLPGCVLVSGNLNPFSSAPQPLHEETVQGDGSAKILQIDVSRVISDQTEEGTFGLSERPGMTARIREELEKAAEDEKVHAILLRINSPGGTVTASDLIYHELMTFKAEHNIPIVAQMLDLGTSGAYYIALAADEIIASPTTVTGSVGVIMVGLNVAGLMDKIGVKNQTLKAGERKDIGSPLRPMTADDERLLQGVLRDMHERFLAVVRQRRPGISAAALKIIADGRIFTADQALQAGLVDRIGYFEDALTAVKRRTGLTDARVVMYRRPQEYAENIYSRAPLGAPQVNLVNLNLGGVHASPQFLYMWQPSSESAVGFGAH